MSETLHVACPSCHTVNRARRDKLVAGLRGTCGACGTPLFDGHPAALGAADFEAHAARSDIPLLVDFWAPWCGPCVAMAPQFEKAAERLEPGVRLAKVNTEDEPALADRFAIQGIPTLVLIHRGREIARRAGAMDAASIERWVTQAMG